MLPIIGDAPVLALAEDLRLLRLELLLGQHAVGTELREALQLRRRARNAGGRHRCGTRGWRRARGTVVAPVHPLLVHLPLVVDRLLHLFGVADVREGTRAELRGRADPKRARAHDPIPDALLEPDVVDRLERD